MTLGSRILTQGLNLILSEYNLLEAEKEAVGATGRHMEEYRRQNRAEFSALMSAATLVSLALQQNRLMIHVEDNDERQNMRTHLDLCSGVLSHRLSLLRKEPDRSEEKAALEEGWRFWQVESDCLLREGCTLIR